MYSVEGYFECNEVNETYAQNYGGLTMLQKVSCCSTTIGHMLRGKNRILTICN